MDNGGGRRVLVPVRPMSLAMPNQGGGGGGGGGAGGGAYAVLQFVGFAHSPHPSPTGNAPPPPPPSTIIWPAVASPAPSPRNATSGSLPAAAIESPRLRSPDGDKAQQHQQGQPQSSGLPLPQLQQQQQQQQQQQVATTFVQADTSSFKEVVQKLTGASDDSHEKKLPITMPARYAPRSNPNPPAPPAPEQQLQPQQQQIPSLGHPHGGANGPAPKPGFEVGPRKPAFKLHERRKNLRNLGIISPPALRLNGRMSPRGLAPPEVLSPSMLDLPSLVLSPVTPLGSDPFDCSSNCPSATNSCNESSVTEEEKAIAEKGFYLHPSPLSTPRDSEPQLLPLFPLHSPKESSS